MPDRVAVIGESTVQHGPANNRVYLMHLSAGDMHGMPGLLIELAGRRGYTKVIARVPAQALDGFLREGYHVEATVPGLYRGREDGFFVARFLDAERASDPSAGVDRSLLGRETSERCRDLPDGFQVREARPEDAAAVAHLYAETFVTYPFPIGDPDHIRKVMAEDVRFFVVVRDGRIVAASSAEMDCTGENVEMTDFAVRQDCRGLRLSAALLQVMEEEMVARGMKTAYTICRAGWYPINRLFAGAGYRYGGTLVRNTQICGRCESMHVWYRPLRGSQKG
ncbi:MAG: putative beta-lysine N-acetyltransferase [Methanofollis sp.]|uniref:putative beta-lysine N-acetyltransferase n=1 Tax=Methanofollis sp. TaxID=2052835 RepID=UPI0026317564|nr:putative beta-lysine N-acetyltransferase [Methanofollis sp.]MDD4255567.1 putative beta-lysine N-acetyltransferase [Methanofollis sp.]